MNTKYDNIISQASEKYNVDESLIKAIIKTESSFNENATSKAGASGLMQLMPSTFEAVKDEGYSDIYNPEQNIFTGTKLFSQLLDSSESVEEALAKYNAGAGNVSRYGKEKYSSYYNKVLSNQRTYKNQAKKETTIPESEQTTDFVHGIVDYAKSLVGKVKYQFGGDNIEGGYGDCSDFTEYVFKHENFSIGGTTEEQYHKSVAVDEPLVGDLVFFKNTYASGYDDGVSHVGIYTGNNKFLHLSSSAGTVVESDLNEKYYKDHFLSFRRVSETSDMVLRGTRDETVSGVARTIIIVALVILVIVFVVLAITKSETGGKVIETISE